MHAEHRWQTSGLGSEQHACDNIFPLHSALEKLQPRVVSFEEPVTLIRERLAEQLEREEQWSKAAGILTGIDLDSGAQGQRWHSSACLLHPCTTIQGLMQG